MSAMQTMVESVVNAESAAYRAGYAQGYLQAKRELSAKTRAPRVSNGIDKRLARSISCAKRSITILENLLPDSWTMVSDEVFDAARLSEICRLNRAVQDPQKLWSIYRRNDKGKPYFAEMEAAQ